MSYKHMSVVFCCVLALIWPELAFVRLIFFEFNSFNESQLGGYMWSVEREKRYMGCLHVNLTLFLPLKFSGTFRPSKIVPLISYCTQKFSSKFRPGPRSGFYAATQIRYVATIATQNRHITTLRAQKKTLCDFAHLKNNILQFCATKVICATLHDLGQVCN